MARNSRGNWPVILVALGALVASARLPLAAAQPEAELIATLAGTNDAVKQNEACRQLLFVGTPTCVPALAAALRDERVGHAALHTLEHLPFPEATGALRSALPRVSGALQLGVIAALGTRRDVAAVPPLSVLLAAPDPPPAVAAARALGRIADDAALSALETAAGRATVAVKVAVQLGLLACADLRLAAGRSGDAARIFRGLALAGSADHVRAAAWCGLVRADETHRSDLLLGAFFGSDLPVQQAALRLLRELPERSALTAILGRWDELSVLQRLAALDAHVAFGADAAATVRRALADADASVRLAALSAATPTGDASLVPALLALATQSAAAERDAARLALARLDGTGVSAALLAELERAPPAGKAEVLRALGERGGDAAALLRSTRHVDEAVANAAYRSLLRLLDPATLPPLLEFALTARSDSERRTQLRVLAALCEHAPNPEVASRHVLATLPRFPAGERPAWLGLLSALSTAAALEEAGAGARGGEPALARAAVLALTQWRSAAAAPVLLDLARHGTVAELKALALKGAIAVVEREPAASNRLVLLEAIAPLVRTPEDQTLLLAQLGRVVLPGAARLAATLLGDREIAETAAGVVTEITAALADATRQLVGSLAPEVLKAARSPDVLERMVALQDRVSPKIPGAPVAPRLPDRDKFRKQRLADLFYAEGAAVGDFNRDGKADLVAGPFWFEGPDFTARHDYREPKAFTPLDYSDAFLTFVDDLNRDGWPDILIVPFPGRECYWYANPQGGAGPWARHLVHPSVGNESPLWGDVDGDGRRELVFCIGGCLGFARPDPADSNLPWVFRQISTSDQRFHRFTHGLGLGDINGDGRADILESAGWWEQPADLRAEKPWTFHPHRFAELAAQMPTTDIDGDGLLDVVTAWNCHQYGLLWWRQVRRADGAIDWERNVILPPEPDLQSSNFRVSQMHALQLADVNGDGRLDLVTGKRFWAHGPAGDKEPAAPAVLLWFEPTRAADGTVRFTPHLIDDKSGVGTQVTAADVNGDGRPDVVVANKKGVFVHLNER